jgi:hypothetical protein
MISNFDYLECGFPNDAYGKQFLSEIAIQKV